MSYNRDQVAEFDYVNYKGEFGVRTVVPVRFFWGESDYHPGYQWLLEAFDLDRRDMRTFAMSGVKNWRVPKS
jgi:predicted DNA-binding transcriptional regulator YafY